MWRQAIIVGTGGFLGTICRYFLGRIITSGWPSAFPWGTFLVNMTGCFLIGIVLPLTGRHGDWRMFLAAGFCGGFTTFSAFASENLTLIQSDQLMTSISYSMASLVLGIGLVAAGALLSRFLF